MQYLTGVVICIYAAIGEQTFAFWKTPIALLLFFWSTSHTAPVDELRGEVQARQQELERRSNYLIEALQEQDRLRKEADALQIRAHQVLTRHDLSNRGNDITSMGPTVCI